MAKDYVKDWAAKAVKEAAAQVKEFESSRKERLAFMQSRPTPDNEVIKGVTAEPSVQQFVADALFDASYEIYSLNLQLKDLEDARAYIKRLMETNEVLTATLCGVSLQNQYGEVETSRAQRKSVYNAWYSYYCHHFVDYGWDELMKVTLALRTENEHGKKIVTEDEFRAIQNMAAQVGWDGQEKEVWRIGFLPNPEENNFSRYYITKGHGGWTTIISQQPMIHLNDYFKGCHTYPEMDCIKRLRGK